MLMHVITKETLLYSKYDFYFFSFKNLLKSLFSLFFIKACFKGCVQAVEFLLNNGASLDAFNDDGETVLTFIFF